MGTGEGKTLDHRRKASDRKRHLNCNIYLLLLITAQTVFGAFLMTMSFRTSHAAWIAWAGLIPLLIVVKSCSPVYTMLFGSVWGASIYAISYIIPGTESHIPHTVSSLILLTIVPAVYSCAGGLLTNWIGFNPLVLALGWFGVELGLLPLGIPNGFLSHTQGDLALVQVIDGSFSFGFLGFLVVFISAIVIKIITVIRFHCLGTHLSSISLRGSDFAILPSSNLCYPFEIILQPSKPRAPPTASI